MQVALAAVSLNMIVLPGFPQLPATRHLPRGPSSRLPRNVHSPFATRREPSELFRLNLASASSVSFYPALSFLALLYLFRFLPTEDFSAPDPMIRKSLDGGGGGGDDSGAEGIE